MEGLVENKSFWGLVIEQGKQYKQIPKFNFHVSMAVLDLKASSDAQPISVYVQVENGEFIICNLNKGQPQINLDLIFNEGEKVIFYTAGGKGNVHLTGYQMPEENMDFGDESDFSDEGSVDSEMLEQLSGKRKNTETLKLAGKDAKKLKTNEGKAAEVAKPKAKIVDVDPKQLLNNKKQPDAKVDQNKKNVPQANQQKKQATPKMPNKDVPVDEDDSSLDDEDNESIDLNKLNQLMDDEESDDDLNDDDLESEDDDLESDDEDVDIGKMNVAKGKPNMQQSKPMAAGGPKANANKPQQASGKKPNQQQNGGPQMNKNQFNKTPQQMNKSNQNTPQNKGQNQQKHNQTPFHNKGQNHNNSNKKNSPFKSGNKNKSFGQQNKGKKVFN